MKKAEKTFFIDNLSEELKVASLVVLVDYTGLSVKKQQALKKALKDVDARLLVVKNTLFKLSTQKTKLDNSIASDEVLSGPTALILGSSDPISPLQVLAKFAKDNEIPKFKVGIVEGNFQDKNGLLRLSSLPKKEILLSQVVGSIASPLYGLVGTLQANMQKLVWILNSKTKA